MAVWQQRLMHATRSSPEGASPRLGACEPPKPLATCMHAVLKSDDEARMIPKELFKHHTVPAPIFDAQKQTQAHTSGRAVVGGGGGNGAGGAGQ